MKTFNVIYKGQSISFRNFSYEIVASSERNAVEEVYSIVLNENYFPQEDGSIRDCDGHEVADASDDRIKYNGGFFSAIAQ